MKEKIMIDIIDHVESELRVTRFENSIINAICDTFCHPYDVYFTGNLNRFYLQHRDRRTWFSKYIYPRKPRYSMLHGWYTPSSVVNKVITIFIRKDIYCNNMIEKFKELDERLTKLGINEVRVHLT